MTAELEPNKALYWSLRRTGSPSLAAWLDAKREPYFRADLSKMARDAK